MPDGDLQPLSRKRVRLHGLVLLVVSAVAFAVAFHLLSRPYTPLLSSLKWLIAIPIAGVCLGGCTIVVGLGPVRFLRESAGFGAALRFLLAIILLGCCGWFLLAVMSIHLTQCQAWEYRD